MRQNAIAAVVLLLLGVALGLYLRDRLPGRPAAAKLVNINSRNLNYQVLTRARTVGELLEEENFPLPQSLVLPAPDTGVISGMTVAVRKPLRVVLTDAGQSQELLTRAATVGELLDEQKIALAGTDRVSPALANFLAEGSKVSIDRIVDLEVTETHDILFATKLEYDPETYYGREAVLSPGTIGKKDQTFMITYKNGIEIRRKFLREKILGKPVTEIRKFGAKIAVEEEREGRASWYAYQKCMCAAHSFYGKGRYVRVTSLASGKSIIVRINDLGPDISLHPERVIDLDAVAFRELASLGAGTIGVRVELLR